MSENIFKKYLGVIIVLLLVAIAVSRWQREWHPEVNSVSEDASTIKLIEVSEQKGITFKFQSPILDPDIDPPDFYVIGGGVAVHDVNNDGWMDFYAVTARSGEKNHLYINQSGNGFLEQAEKWGVADLNGEPVKRSKYGMTVDEPEYTSSLAPIFFDYNNDGLVDLFIARLACSILLKNTGERFEEVTGKEGFNDCNNAQSAVPVDINEDGFLDLYLMRYQGAFDLYNLDSDDIWVNSLFNATNGGINSVFLNRNGAVFENATDTVGGADFHWSLDANIGEFVNEGEINLLVSNDYGPDTLYLIQAGKLVDVSSKLGPPDRRLGMGVTPGYLEGPRPFIHVSNAFHPLYRNEGNFLWRTDQESGFHDTAMQAGTNNCGWAWSAAFSDLDLDGDLDLYVANGFLTSNKKSAKDLSFNIGTLQSLPGLVTSDVTQFDKVVGDVKDEEFQFAGNEVDCLFLNDKGKFKNISKDAGITTIWDGRAVATIDIDNNGVQELLVNTRKNGLLLFQSSTEPAKNWIGFRLRSRSLKRDVVGAKITVTQGKRSWYRYATGGKSGFLTISDPRLHVGLESEMPVQLEIRWPNSKIEQFFNLTPGAYYDFWQE